MREPKEKPKPLRLVPPITQKLLEENAEFQKQVRRGLNTGPVDQRVLHRSRQLLIIEETNAILQMKFRARRSAMKAGDDTKREALEADIARLRNKVSRAYFEIGDFEQARMTTLDRDRRRLCREHLTAMGIDDELHCEHAKYKLHEGQRYPNYFRERDIYSVKHGKFVSVIKCNECSFRNIKELPEDLAEASRKRAEFRERAKQPSAA